MKKSVAILLALLLSFTFSTPVFATADMEATTEHPKTTEYPDDPSREPDLVSNAAIVIDSATGQILYEKNAYEKKYPASITKIMSCLVALDQDIDFDDTITMSENAVWGIDRLSSHISLDVGEKITVKDCIYGMMLYSANECAYALAEYVAGDVESFASMMNDKAAEIGCQSTHFVTPNGLHDDDHYTCAYDMALITQAALQNDTFREITGTLNYTIPATNMNDERFFWNGNKMINPAEFNYYEYCEGGKTGYTSIANNTLVTYSKKDDLELLCVVLDCDGRDYAYSDSRALYNYCFNNYTYFYPLSGFSFDSEEDNAIVTNAILNNFYTNLDHEMIDLVIDQNYSILINKSLDTTRIEQNIMLYDYAQDNVLGEITFTYNGEQIGSTSITSSNPSFSSTLDPQQPEEEKNTWKTVKKVLFTILIVVLALIAVFVIYLIFAAIIRKIRQSSTRKRYRYRKRHKKRDDDYYW